MIYYCYQIAALQFTHGTLWHEQRIALNSGDCADAPEAAGTQNIAGIGKLNSYDDCARPNVNLAIERIKTSFVRKRTTIREFELPFQFAQRRFFAGPLLHF